MDSTPTAFSSRGSTPADEPLLFQLFAAVKGDEFASLGLPPSALEPLLQMQYRARDASYSQAYAAAVNIILCLPDGTPVGRHLIERQPNAYRTIDIAVLPEYRGRGLGAWALQQFQKVAELEAIPMRLSVFKSNPGAQRLYQRLGYVPTGEDELSIEMEWRPTSQRAAMRARLAPEVPVGEGQTGIPRQEVLDRLLAFLREIGLTIELAALPSNTFLPGMQVISNGLRLDLDALLYPGDLLHEAGHLAVMPPSRRHSADPKSNDMAEEITAQAWSYAACVHIGLPPEVVFHDNGYKGQAKRLRSLYSESGSHVVPGVPLLAWMGLTTQPKPDSPSIYPKMLRWLREIETPGEEAHP